MRCRRSAQAADPVRRELLQVHPGRIHFWHPSTAAFGIGSRMVICSPIAGGQALGDGVHVTQLDGSDGVDCFADSGVQPSRQANSTDAGIT